MPLQLCEPRLNLNQLDGMSGSADYLRHAVGLGYR
jgi:hypothetical protein